MVFIDFLMVFSDLFHGFRDVFMFSPHFNTSTTRLTGICMYLLHVGASNVHVGFVRDFLGII